MVLLGNARRLGNPPDGGWHCASYLEDAVKPLSLFLLLAALAPISRAQLVMFEAHLTGSQETPSNASAGTGFATASLDLATDLFIFSDSWSGLSAPDTATHIHAPAPPGTSASVIIPFTAANGFVAGLTSGSVSYTNTLTPTQASQLLAGLFYVNVHTTVFPGGEIRGQLLAVPEPATYGVGGIALLGLLAAGRRIRSART